MHNIFIDDINVNQFLNYLTEKQKQFLIDFMELNELMQLRFNHGFLVTIEQLMGIK